MFSTIMRLNKLRMEYSFFFVYIIFKKNNLKYEISVRLFNYTLCDTDMSIKIQLFSNNCL